MIRKSSEARLGGEINNPSRRAYQIEYRFKKADIFYPFIPTLEYAVYDALCGNYICAYLSLLPIVEAVLRKWGELQPALTLNKAKGFGKELFRYLNDNLHVFDDERIAIVNGYVDYFIYMLKDVLYIDFDTYKNSEFSDIFNRNLALHKLEGVMDIEMGLANVTRTLLLLDIIDEIYLLQIPEIWWNNVFQADMETNIDYQLRQQLYIKTAMLSIGLNDLLIIGNAFLNSISEEDKIAATQQLKATIKFIMGSH